MNTSSRKPPATAPPVYRPVVGGHSAQLKPSDNFRLETRPAPPVFRPQQSGAPSQPKMQAPSVQPQSQYEVAPPVWVGKGRQQIRIRAKLVKAALDSARRHGSTATELEANPGPGSISRQALVSMYQKLGFRNTGFSTRGNPKMSAR